MTPETSPPFEILIPVYRVDPLLAECLGACLDQDVENYRLTVVDNGAGDDLGRVLAGFDDPRLNLVRFPSGLGLSGDFNRCLDAAEAPVFTIIHADDRPRRTFVRRALAAAESWPDAWIVFSRGALIDAEGHPLMTTKQRLRNAIYRMRGPRLAGERGLRLLASYNHVMCPCAIFRKAHLPEDLRFDPDMTYLTDQAFWLNTLLKGGVIAQVDEVFYDHRVHAGQLSSRLRHSDSTIDEVERFACKLAGHPRALAAWRRYGRKFALRNWILGLLEK